MLDALAGAEKAWRPTSGPRVRFLLEATDTGCNFCWFEYRHHVHNFLKHLISFLVGSEVLTAVSPKIAVFTVVAPCNYLHFGGTCCLNHHGDGSWRQGATENVWYVGKHPPDCTALQSKRQPSSDSTPRTSRLSKRGFLADAMLEIGHRSGQIARGNKFCENVLSDTRHEAFGGGGMVVVSAFIRRAQRIRFLVHWVGGCNLSDDIAAPRGPRRSINHPVSPVTRRLYYQVNFVLADAYPQISQLFY